MKYYITLFCSLLIPFSLLAAAVLFRDRELRPEERIVGRWDEVSWTYAKADNKGAVQFGKEPLSESVKHLISQSKIIHKAEQWDFRPGALLDLHTADKDVHLDWSILGNGNVLRIRYNNDYEETYQLVELNDKRMVLHFESEQLTRGIVRITFARI
ncbi:lipocalin family protein [Rurimicrobium arvi]|uniref:Lipocalin-like domain-containing protein n=1 Tax=Rurimicrobium arvi TaxID=2049916 RepID=A0ABP8MKS5_9BACT